MSELYDEMVRMQEDTMKSVQPEIDEDTIDKSYGFCSYCESEEEIEILEENRGLCEDCFQEALNDWKGVK